MSKTERVLQEHRISCTICRNGNKLCGPAADYMKKNVNGAASSV